jgi:hypothetical protein
MTATTTASPTTEIRRVAVALVVLLVAGAAHAETVCGGPCRAIITGAFRTCRAACPAGRSRRVCRRACRANRRARLAACRTAGTATPPDCGRPSFVCTEVLGFSQTGMWVLDVAHGGGGTFEPLVGDASWQLRAYQGSGVDWQDPSFLGWTTTPYSPCTSGSASPDRVLLTISTPSGRPSVSWWVTNIRAELATIRQKHPAVREIILQSVVGGPGGRVCYVNGDPRMPVHASVIHPTIDQAIAQVVGGDVLAGMSPTVRTCDDYMDDTGHLTPSARPAIGTLIGEYYATFQ